MKEVSKKSSASFSLERTLLANERTLLAYIRTAFSSFLLAIVLLKFLDDGFVNYLGWFFFILSAIFVVIGVWYYVWRRNKLMGAFGYMVKK